MKKNGFITSALLYGMLALFIVLMLSTLAILANRKLSMDNLKSAALKQSKEDVIILNAAETLLLKSSEEKQADGLKIDSAPEIVGDTRYVYKGASPKNYLKLKDGLWRIVSIESAGNLKIMKNDIIENGIVYDEKDTRYVQNGYCNKKTGCNIWSNNTDTYNKDLNKITTIPRKFGDLINYALPAKSSTMNIYLNTTYYNGLSNEIKELIIEGKFNVGSLVYDSTKAQTLQNDVNQVSSVKWIGKIGLIDATEYIKASDNANCLSYASGGYYSATGAYCKNDNYMYLASKFWQTLTPSSGTVDSVLSLRGGTAENDGYLAAAAAWLGTSIRPTFYLKEEVKIVNGDGTKENPYEVAL